MLKHEPHGTLEVIGEGMVMVEPDVASVQLAVLTEAPTAETASQQNAQTVTSIIAAMGRLDIPEHRIKTIGLSLQPMYEYNERVRRNELVGYRARNGILVETDVSQAGRVFDAGIEAGANQSSGLTFLVKDERPHRMRALESAVAVARADADAVALASCVRIVGPKTIEILQGGGPIETERTVKLGTDPHTPVMPGELTMSARVRIVYGYQTKN